MADRGVSVVVPVYGSASTLAALHARLTDVFANAGRDYELIFVDDGSIDHSWSVVRSLAHADPHLSGVRLSRNFGQHNALLYGIRSAKHPITVTLDDDLQNPPEEIPRLLAALDDETDLVYGYPLHDHHDPWRVIASKATKLALREAQGHHRISQVSAFRAFRTDLRDAFADYASPFVCIDVLLSWGTSRIVAIPVKHDPRTQGRSAYSRRRLIEHAFNMITGFTSRPLELTSMAGFAVTVMGVAILLYVVLRFLIAGASVPGFTFLASIVTIFSGAQLFTLGVFGQYLARMHFRLMGRPPYVVASDVGYAGADLGETEALANEAEIRHSV